MPVCILPRRQQPNGISMAPTYPIGGSNFSHTRQGGILIKPAIMGLALLGKTIRKDKKNRISESVSSDFLINSFHYIHCKPTVFSLPKVLSKT